jgi:hypothetical protein
VKLYYTSIIGLISLHTVHSLFIVSTRYAIIRAILIEMSADKPSIPIFRSTTRDTKEGPETAGINTTTLTVPRSASAVFWDDGLGRVRWLHKSPKSTDKCSSEPVEINTMKMHRWYMEWQGQSEDTYETTTKTVPLTALFLQLGSPRDFVHGSSSGTRTGRACGTNTKQVDKRLRVLRGVVTPTYKARTEAALNGRFGWSGDKTVVLVAMNKEMHQVTRQAQEQLEAAAAAAKATAKAL